MTDTPRAPHPDNDLIDQADEFDTPSQSGSSGGDLAREIGQRDEARTALEDAGEGRDPTVTAVHKGDKPHGGDAPNLPNREGGGKHSERAKSHVPPRRA